MDIHGKHISNRFGKPISMETKEQLSCFKKYFHGDLGCCEEKRNTKKISPSPPELSAEELKVNFAYYHFIYNLV